MKICSSCKICLDESLFGKDKRNKDKCAARCLDCIRKFSKAYYNNNKEKVIKRTKKYYQTNKDFYKKYAEKYYLENTPKYKEASKKCYAKHLDFYKQQRKIWRHNNKKKLAYYTAQYRSAKWQRTPAWSDLKQIEYIYENCPEGYHVDHIVPLRGKNVSGLNVPWNLQYLTAQENFRKNNNFYIKV